MNSRCETYPGVNPTQSLHTFGSGWDMVSVECVKLSVVLSPLLSLCGLTPFSFPPSAVGEPHFHSLCANPSQEVIFQAYVSLATTKKPTTDAPTSGGGGPQPSGASGVGRHDPPLTHMTHHLTPWGVMECLATLLKSSLASNSSSLEAMARKLQGIIWPEEGGSADVAGVEGGLHRKCSGAYGCASVGLVYRLADSNGVVSDEKWLVAAVKLLAEKTNSLKARSYVMVSLCKVCRG